MNVSIVEHFQESLSVNTCMFKTFNHLSETTTMKNFISDYGSEIQLANVPYPCLQEKFEKRSEHGLWEGINTIQWIKTILTQHQLSWRYKQSFKEPEGRWFYHVFEIDEVNHVYSIAKKDNTVWVVAENIDIKT